MSSAIMNSYEDETQMGMDGGASRQCRLLIFLFLDIFKECLC